MLRAVASLTVPGGQEFHFPYFFLKFQLIFLIFPQTLLIFFLIFALRVGESPTREGPGYATEHAQIWVGYGWPAGIVDYHFIGKPENVQIWNTCVNHLFLEGPFL